MPQTDVAIIGAGQSGLAVSRSLTALGIDHVVLERGRAGERWFTQRWDGLRLLTTTRMSALPGLSHEGQDPDGFMPAVKFAHYLARYSQAMSVPLQAGTSVRKLTVENGRYQLQTSLGTWRAHAVVIATGACDTPHRAPVSAALDSRLYQIDAAHYRRPDALPEGGVLVVGASASGVQLAEEIQASGRPVTLSVGEHLGAPRSYRGSDFYVWLDRLGVLSEAITDPLHRAAMLRQPSLQLIGSPERRDISLGTLAAQGVRLTGRLCGTQGRRAEFDDSLAANMALADARKLRLLDRLDQAIDRHYPGSPGADPIARAPIRAQRDAEALDLYDRGIRSVVWATGYSRRYSWLRLPLTDSRGELVHDQGKLALPGLFTIGLNFLRRRQSALILGCGQDAADLATQIKAHLDQCKHRAA